MSTITFEYASLQYLNQWLYKDKKYSEVLSENNEEEKLKILKDAAVFYNVARTLQNSQNETYKPLLEILEDNNYGKFKTDTICSTIKIIERKISAIYGGKSVLSATTKFLWLKNKQPILIYDSRSRKSLKTKNNDIEDFYSKWRLCYNQHKSKIKNVCSRLPNLNLYSINPELGTKNYIEQISSENWFHERVFDIYLWNKGK